MRELTEEELRWIAKFALEPVRRKPRFNHGWVLAFAIYGLMWLIIIQVAL